MWTVRIGKRNFPLHKTHVMFAYKTLGLRMFFYKNLKCFWIMIRLCCGGVKLRTLYVGRFGTNKCPGFPLLHSLPKITSHMIRFGRISATSMKTNLKWQSGFLGKLGFESPARKVKSFVCFLTSLGPLSASGLRCIFFCTVWASPTLEPRMSVWTIWKHTAGSLWKIRHSEKWVVTHGKADFLHYKTQRDVRLRSAHYAHCIIWFFFTTTAM